MLTANAKLFGLLSLLLGGGAIVMDAGLRLPGNHRGYAPEQPIAFSHRLHAGELQMDCQYCHSGARRSRHAGVPSASVCMKCHERLTSGLDALLSEKELAAAEGREPRPPVSSELAKLYAGVGFDPETGLTDPTAALGVEWVRVHNLQDFAWFDHRPHVARGLACETCHGPVQSMDRLRQEAPMTMGWCLDCHRSSAREPDGLAGTGRTRAPDHVTTDCVNCHL